MDRRTMSNRKIEIKSPCLTDINFLLNIHAENTQTAKVNLHRKKMGCHSIERGKSFRKLHFQKEELRRILALLLILELHCNYFAEQIY